MGTYTAFVTEKSNIAVIGAQRGTQNTSMLTNEAISTEAWNFNESTKQTSFGKSDLYIQLLTL